MRLTIGTAQFGLNYGYTNTSGKVSENEAARIVELAKDYGVSSFDTARNYGNSEKVLSSILPADARITTKLTSKPKGQGEVDWIKQSIAVSLDTLNKKSLDTVLVHNCDDLINADVCEIKELIASLKASNSIRRFGVSVYYPEQLKIIEKFAFDTVQVPFNLVDRRFQQDDMFAKLKSFGVEIEARSIFLQGLLLLNSHQLPGPFVGWSNIWKELDDWCSLRGVSRLNACLSFVASFHCIDRIVIGVQDEKQLRAILDAYLNPIVSDFPDLSCSDESLIIPSNWKKHG